MLAEGGGDDVEGGGVVSSIGTVWEEGVKRFEGVRDEDGVVDEREPGVRLVLAQIDGGDEVQCVVKLAVASRVKGHLDAGFFKFERAARMGVLG